MMDESEEEPVPWTEPMDSEIFSELGEPPIINKFPSSNALDDQWLLTSSIKYQMKVEGRPLKNLNLDEPPGHIVTCTKAAAEDGEENEEAETVVDPGKAGSITTPLIPTEEWLLIPSLKYKLMMEAERKRSSLEPGDEKCGKGELEAIMEKSKVDTAAEAEEEEWLLVPSIKYQLMLQSRRSRKLKAAKMKCETGDEPGSSEEEEMEMDMEMEGGGSEGKEGQLQLDEEEHTQEEEETEAPPKEPFEGYLDLGSIRWFGNILNTAHKRRPSFVPDPKDSLKAMRAESGSKKQPITTTVRTSIGSRKSGAGSAAGSVRSKKEIEDDKDKEVKEIKEGGKEKKKKDKKAKIKDKEGDDGPQKKVPKESGAPTTVNMLTIETDIEPKIPKLVDDYPTDLQDLREVYEVMEKAWREAPKINSKDQTLRKAVVVRSALLAARMSFLNTCRSEADIYKDGEGEEENKAQSDYKQQQQKNIDDMQFTAKVLGQCIDFTFN